MVVGIDSCARFVVGFPDVVALHTHTHTHHTHTHTLTSMPLGRAKPQQFLAARNIVIMSTTVWSFNTASFSLRITDDEII